MGYNLMTKFVDESAKIGKNFNNGFNSVVMAHVNIGNNVTIGCNVVIYPFTRISDDVEVLDNAVIGKQPSKVSIITRKIEELMSPCEIGQGSVIGTSAIIYAGTKIGKYCLIADLASIREKCVVKDYVIIGRAVTVEYETTIGEHTKIMTHSQITGNMTIEDHVFFGGAVASTNDKYMGRTGNQFNGPTVRSGARIGANATILAGVTVGKEAVIGAGAVVTCDIPDFKVAVGVPAKVTKDVPKDQRIELEEIQRE
jgi:UDP-2-acetamido-3-amino-2,3-dideoxy-glucuronate N-acetyltransferase